MQNTTICLKNGLVPHRLATLFDSTNAVRKPEKGDQIVHGVKVKLTLNTLSALSHERS